MTGTSHNTISLTGMEKHGSAVHRVLLNHLFGDLWSKTLMLS